MSEHRPNLSLNVLSTTKKVEEFRRDLIANPIKPAAQPAVSTVSSPDHSELEAKIIAALKTVFDPEIPVSIYDLGLIYSIDIADDCAVKIQMTLTAPACPVAGMIVAEVQRKVAGIAGVTKSDIDLVWDPPWRKDRMSEVALLELGLL
jgi:FeS assembly SUF system protein